MRFEPTSSVRAAASQAFQIPLLGLETLHGVCEAGASPCSKLLHDMMFCFYTYKYPFFSDQYGGFCSSPASCL